MGWFWGDGSGGVPADVPSPDQDRDLVLYQYPSCGYCHRVRSRIEDLGLTVPMRDTLADPAARAALLAATGRTQVPCLFIDGVPLFESADINAWLAAYAARGRVSGAAVRS